MSRPTIADLERILDQEEDVETWIMHTTNAPSAGPARLMPLVVE